MVPLFVPNLNPWIGLSCYLIERPHVMVYVVGVAAAVAGVLLLLLLFLLLRFKTYVQQRVAGSSRKKTKTKVGFSISRTRLGEAEDNPSFLESAQRRSMPQAPLRCAAGIQSCVVMYPRRPCLPRSLKCEKEPSAAGDQQAKKKMHLHIDTRFPFGVWVA